MRSEVASAGAISPDTTRPTVSQMGISTPQ